MMSMTNCPLWGNGYAAEVTNDSNSMNTTIVDSPRAGGEYSFQRAMVDWTEMNDVEKARLTTTLVDLRVHVNRPEITTQMVEGAKNRPPLRADERADRLLRHLAQITVKVGELVNTTYNDHGVWFPMMAWSESTTDEEVDYLIDYLIREGCITDGPTIDGGHHIVVSVSGYERIKQQLTRQDLTRGFVAMWFDPETKEAYDNGIAPAIKSAGYEPVRIDDLLATGETAKDKVDDAIIAEIRRSRFVVADFTGLRGGVYYEAGFAEGLGIPVFYSCRADYIDKLHFDTRQIYHVPWDTPTKLYQGLFNRIRMRLGEGPVAGGQ